MLDIKLKSNNKKLCKDIYLIVLIGIIAFYIGLGLFYKPIKTIAYEKINSYNELYLKAVWGIGNKDKK